ncbi:MAG TPA: 2'-5' RNA ligase family protein [Patescibacteria group bacterium]|nr:2'-5' RNA ligase family protein [Patescibacteria group bacterium]
MKYSIWLIPPEPAFSQIKSVIKQLSNDYGGPLFEPHITLVGNIDQDLSQIEKKLKLLSSGIEKFELSFGPVSFSTTYFQSVFLRVNSTAKLMDLSLTIKTTLGLENDVYMPHASLLYGNHSMTVREEIASKIHFPKMSFLANEFIITPSTPNPKEWVHSAVIPFV